MSETNERPAVSACEGKTAPDFVLRDGDQQRLQQEVQGTGHLSSDSAAVSMLQPRGELTKQPDDAAHPPEEGGSGACLDAAPGTGGSAPLHNAVDQAAGGDGGSSGPHEDRAGTDIGAAQGAAEQDPSSKSTFQAGEDKASLDSGSERRGVSTAPDTDSHQPAAPAATDAQQEPGRGGDQTLGKRARRPSSKAFQDEVAAAKPASEELKTPKLLEKGAAKAVGERQLRATKPLEADALLSTSPEAQCLTLLRGKNNRVWRNGRWHRMTAEGIPVICEKRMREGLEESGSAKRTRTSNVRRPAGEPGDAARKLRMPRRERPDRTPCQNAPDNLPLGPRQQRVKVPKDALCATRTAQQWKMTKSGSTSGGTQYLDQVYLVAYLYDKLRDVSIRIDNTGLFWTRGRDDKMSNKKWNLIEKGLFESHAKWCNSDKTKMLVAEHAADGTANLWCEQQNDKRYSCFEETEAKAYLRDSAPKEGKTRYICVSATRVLKCEVPAGWGSDCESSDFLKMLESLEWESLANGLWTHPGTHLLSWKGNSATGAGGPVSLTALPLDAVKKTKIEPIGVQSVVRRDHQRSKERGRMPERRSHHKAIHSRLKKVVNAVRSRKVQLQNDSAPAVLPREDTCCFCGQQVDDAEMVSCDMCGCCAHSNCVKASADVEPWKCTKCAKPKASLKKRALDDGARGLAHSRNAEEARAAKKKARREREQETRVLAKKLADQGLCTVEIPADGHCLFSALSDQLKRTGGEEHSYKSLRRAAADYMMKNEQHFKGFLSLESNTFEAYCRRIERTNAWGGQHELIALSHYLKRNIQVLRHDMSIQMFPDPETHEPYEGDPLRLSYHIHEYSGGEHYNSVVSVEEKNRRIRAHRVHRAEEVAKLTVSESGAAGAAERPKLTEEERLKKMGAKGREMLARPKVMVAGGVKRPIPWVRGVGGSDCRVVVWDTRDGRLHSGANCPIAKNIDRYLADKPHMRIWQGGIDGEPVWKGEDLGVAGPAGQGTEIKSSSSVGVGGVTAEVVDKAGKEVIGQEELAGHIHKEAEEEGRVPGKEMPDAHQSKDSEGSQVPAHGQFAASGTYGVGKGEKDGEGCASASTDSGDSSSAQVDAQSNEDKTNADPTMPCSRNMSAPVLEGSNSVAQNEMELQAEHKEAGCEGGPALISV